MIPQVERTGAGPTVLSRFWNQDIGCDGPLCPPERLLPTLVRIAPLCSVLPLRFLSQPAPVTLCPRSTQSRR